MVHPPIRRIQPGRLLALPHGLSQPTQPHQRSRTVAPARSIGWEHGHRLIVEPQRLDVVPPLVLLVPRLRHQLRVRASRRSPRTRIHQAPSPRIGSRDAAARPAAHDTAVAVVPGAGAENVAPGRGPWHHAGDLPRGADIARGKHIGQRRTRRATTAAAATVAVREDQRARARATVPGLGAPAAVCGSGGAGIAGRRGRGLARRGAGGAGAAAGVGGGRNAWPEGGNRGAEGAAVVVNLVLARPLAQSQRGAEPVNHRVELGPPPGPSAGLAGAGHLG